MPAVLHIYTQGMYKDFLSFDSVDFVLVANFFNRTTDSDIEMVPEIRRAFPDAVLVARSFFDLSDESIYDFIVSTEDDGKSFGLLCEKIAEKIKSA